MMKKWLWIFFNLARYCFELDLENKEACKIQWENVGISELTKVAIDWTPGILGRTTAIQPNFDCYCCCVLIGQSNLLRNVLLPLERQWKPKIMLKLLCRIAYIFLSIFKLLAGVVHKKALYGLWKILLLFFPRCMEICWHFSLLHMAKYESINAELVCYRRLWSKNIPV